MKLFNNAISAMVVGVIFLIIVPLPTWLLDFMFITNLSLSFVILLTTMYIRRALDFSIYPSILLITTLFRLALNISSTRSILSNQGYAGEVVKTFGEFVIRGDVVVGLVIFLIIVLVQFLVITKGSERVAEVSARFTLDAMPGKQMAIDADLSSGLIDEQGAKARRAKIQKEADFYGAMDGATKFVKGDATLSLIVTAINFVGGLIMGVTIGKMEMGAAVQTYSIATIGDGLVSQIPSLMISTATAMVVTRTVSDGSLNDDVVRQFLGQPKAILTAGLVIALLGCIPGTPHVPLLLVGLGLAVSGWFISTQTDKQQAEVAAAEAAAAAVPEEAPQPSANEFYKDINNVYTLLTVDPIEMEFGYSLIPMVDENSGGKLIGRIVIFRRQYAQDMGFVIPSIRFHDSSALGTNQYVVKIKGEEVARGEILVDYYLALEPANPTGEIDGIETVEPAYGIPSRWILPENKEMAEIYGYTVIDPLSVMQTHLSEVVRSHAYELLGRAEVIQLVENLKRTSPELVEEAIPNFLSYAHLERILRNLLREGVPIRDLGTILETAVDALAATKDLDMVTENVRGALARTITRRFCEHGQLRVVTLDAEVEKRVIASLSKNEQGIYLAMGPDLMQQIVTQLADLIKKFNDLGQTPIVLTSQVIRVYFSRMLAQFYPNLYVLAFNEITSDVQIQSLGNISLTRDSQRKAAAV